jgi:hypothetical protein
MPLIGLIVPHTLTLRFKRFSARFTVIKIILVHMMVNTYVIFYLL